MAQNIPKPHMLRSKRKRRWNVADALAELIDNGLSEGKGNAETVYIDITPKALRVWDDGVGTDDINRLFTFGDSSTADLAGEIGQYGIGATDCAVWMAPILEAWTIHNGIAHHHKVDWEKVEASDWPEAYSGKGVRATGANVPIELAKAGQGTMLIMRRPTRFGGGFKFDRMVDRLGHLFGPGLRSGRRLRVRYRPANKRIGQRAWKDVQPYSPPSLMAEMEISDTVEVDGRHLTWTGRAGLAEGITAEHNAVHIGYAHRIIESTREPFGGVDAPTIYAEVNLGPEWKSELTDHKDAIEEAHRDELMQSIEQQLGELLDVASKDEQELRNTEIALMLESMLAGALSGRSGQGVLQELEGYERTGPENDVDSGNDNIADEPGEPEEDGPDTVSDPDSQGNKTNPMGIRIVWDDDAWLDGKLTQVDITETAIVVHLNADHPLLEDSRRLPYNPPVLLTTIAHALAIELAFLIESGKDLTTVVPRLDSMVAEDDTVNLMAFKLARTMLDASYTSSKRGNAKKKVA